MARGDKKIYNSQEPQAFNQAKDIAGWSNFQQKQLLSDLVPKLNDQFNNAGYTTSEKQAMLNSGSLNTAGVYADAQNQLADQVARTGNDAGFAAGEEELAREKARDLAGNSAALQGKFAGARIQGQQNALRGLEGLVPAMTGAESVGMNGMTANVGRQAQVAMQPGFWSQLFANAVRNAGASGGAGQGIGWSI